MHAGSLARADAQCSAVLSSAAPPCSLLWAQPTCLEQTKSLNPSQTKAMRSFLAVVSAASFHHVWSKPDFLEIFSFLVDGKSISGLYHHSTDYIVPCQVIAEFTSVHFCSYATFS